MTKPVKRKAKGSVKAWGVFCEHREFEVWNDIEDSRALARRWAAITNGRVRPIRITVLKGKG